MDFCYLCIRNNYSSDMKRLTLAIFLSLLLPSLMFGQAQITTKKYRISDFPDKTTKIVLSGNDFEDNLLWQEISRRWTISAYEFCTREEFEELKTSDNYYFLMTVNERAPKESGDGTVMLTLVKGGPKATEGISAMQEVISVPFYAADGGPGRGVVYLPALIDIIQDFVPRAMEKDIAGYSGLLNYSSNIYRSRDMNVLFSEDDLAGSVTESVRTKHFGHGMAIVDEAEADEAFDGHSFNTLVSFVVASEDPEPGSYCYLMLISADTHELYYFKRRKIRRPEDRGFLPEDIQKIARRR